MGRILPVIHARMEKEMGPPSFGWVCLKQNLTKATSLLSDNIEKGVYAWLPNSLHET